MNKTVVIDIVGLSQNLVGKDTPFLQQFIAKNKVSAIQPQLPAVTTSSQSTYITGRPPSGHGIVGNGWYDRDDCEIKFWKQPDTLVAAPKIWEEAKKKDPDFTCSKMFWWYNMYSKVAFSATPRPQYHADGVKLPDCYTFPAALRDELQSRFGTFPLFNFWGPNANIKSSEWIAKASMYVDEKNNPDLTLIYLPHLDYCLQKYGPGAREIIPELNHIDHLVKTLVEYYESKNTKIILLSEYGINPVNNPIHINRILRKNNLISVRVESGHELLDAGASAAFAVADHQIAHIYVNDNTVYDTVEATLQEITDIELILNKENQKEYNIDHHRSGDFVVMANPDSWFTYYYWLEEEKRPDYANMVDIHRKPGYDPVEMFMDPLNPFVKIKAGYKLLRKKLGFRYRMNVIPTDATLVKGSHGSIGVPPEYYPVISSSEGITNPMISATDVYSVIWDHLFDGE